jgi:GT2 family glycosyltransferase
MNTLYGMVTLKVTNEYADKAVDSFLRNTYLEPGDRFIMIDNDGDFKSNWNNGRIKEEDIIVNSKIENFSHNMNILMRIAVEEEKNLIFMSNDVIFTPNWSKLLGNSDYILTVPSCNQTHTDLGIPGFLSLNDFNERYDILNQISEHVNKQPSYFQRMLMAFYVCRIPLKIIKEVGEYDEMFTVGGEDVDYRLRCLMKGFGVTYTPSFLLHFNGKSSWNGVENTQQIKEREYKYTMQFISKWGLDLKDLCLVNTDVMRVVNKYNLYNFMNEGNYNGLLLYVINKTSMSK